MCRVLCVLLFVAWTEESQSLVYEGHWKSIFAVLDPIVTSLPGINLSPWQLTLIALAPFCLFWPGAMRRRSSVLDGAIVVSLASIALGLAWGLAHGGSGYQAYFQLRAFLTALLLAALLSGAMRNKRDLIAVGATVLAAGVVRATLVLYFYFYHVKGKIVPPPTYMTTHEDSLLFAAGILIFLSWALARRRWLSWLWAGMGSAYLLWAITLNGRRLAWVNLVLGMVFIYAQLPRGRQRARIHLALMALAPLFLLYAAVGWGRTEAVFEPLRAFSSAGSDADNSSLARLEEVRNLLFTLAESNPVLGQGWGLPYQKTTSVFANFGPDWWQYLYMPHNSFIGMIAFGGLVGLFGMWIVVPVAAFLGTRGYVGARRPPERAAAMAAVAVLPAFGAQCYGDLGMKQLACTLVAGTAIAVAATTATWARQAAPSRATRRNDLNSSAVARDGPEPPPTKLKEAESTPAPTQTGTA